MEIKKFKGESAFLVSVNPTQVVDYVCMTCYKRLNKIIRTITKESRPYQEDIWYEYGERDYKYSNLYLNDTNGFIYGFDKDEEDGKLVDKALHSYEPHQCPYCGKWACAIDNKIIPHIIELNKKGWKTEFSCSGHKHNGLFERKFEYDDGRVVRRNKIYWTSPYVKFSSDVIDFVDYYMNMNEKKIKYNYLPFYEYSNGSLHPEGSNVINSEKDYNELIESFLEFCESLPNIREVKKEFEEKYGEDYPMIAPTFDLKLPNSHPINIFTPFINTPFWMQDYIEKDKLWTEETKNRFINDFFILGPRQCGKTDAIKKIADKLGLSSQPCFDPPSDYGNITSYGNITTEITMSSLYNRFTPEELESLLKENGVEIIDKELLKEEEKLKKTLEEAKDLFENMSKDTQNLKGYLDLLVNSDFNITMKDIDEDIKKGLEIAIKSFEEEISKEMEASSFEKEKNQKPMRKDDFNSIDVPSPEEIAKAMANEFETEGSVSGEVVNRWKESIDKGKLGLKRKSQEWIDEMIKMQELEDEKIRRINEAQINIWDGYLDENGKLCISKSQFIRDFKEVHKDDPIFDLPIYSKEYLDVAWRCFLNDISDITKDKKAVLEEYFTPEKEKEQKEDENFIDDLFDSIDEDYGDEDEL